LYIFLKIQKGLHCNIFFYQVQAGDKNNADISTYRKHYGDHNQISTPSGTTNQY